jgi:hypothetical protein
MDRGTAGPGAADSGAGYQICHYLRPASQRMKTATVAVAASFFNRSF